MNLKGCHLEVILGTGKKIRAPVHGFYASHLVDVYTGLSNARQIALNE
jgi:hypothetical protein